MPAGPISQESVTADVGAEPLDPLLGVTLDGRFRIVEVIGKGAMGKVYRAVQEPLNRPVALKVLDSRYGAGRDETFRQRFLVEAALTAKLSHPNTVRVLDYGRTVDGLYYLAMEYLVGETLEAKLKRGPVSWRRVLSIGQQLARALKEAHSLGVVHRDLKPANIVILNADDDAEHVKVLDFGLVKSFVDGQELEGRVITQQGMLMGSPPYMAPEQGERNRADPRSDIYSLGAVLFECLTGQPPFTGGAPLEIILKHVHNPVPPIVAPAGLETVPELMKALVNKCLAKSPMDRFQTMDEVLVAMQELAAPITTPPMEQPATSAEPAQAPPPKAGGAALLVGFAVALLVGVTGTVVVMKARIDAAPAPAAAAPTAAASIVFHVETDPPGAIATLQGKQVGVTPFELRRPAGSGNVELTLKKDGFTPLTVTAGGSGPRVEIRERLQPAPRPTPVLAPPEVKAVGPRPPRKKTPGAESPPTAPRKVVRPAAKLDEDDEPSVIAPPPSNELKRPAALKKQPAP